jgi:TM2 domain-containing membrane protein YozV
MNRIKTFTLTLISSLLFAGMVYAAFPILKNDSTYNNTENIHFKKEKKQQKEIIKAFRKHKTDTKHENGKSQIIALILAIIVGWLGVHRFYLGYTGIGVIQFFTFGGCYIWALIDIIRIATGDLQPIDGEYTETV